MGRSATARAVAPAMPVAIVGQADRAVSERRAIEEGQGNLMVPEPEEAIAHRRKAVRDEVRHCDARQFGQVPNRVGIELQDSPP